MLTTRLLSARYHPPAGLDGPGTIESIMGNEGLYVEVIGRTRIDAYVAVSVCLSLGRWPSDSNGRSVIDLWKSSSRLRLWCFGTGVSFQVSLDPHPTERRL